MISEKSRAVQFSRRNETGLRGKVIENGKVIDESSVSGRNTVIYFLRFVLVN